MIGIVIAACGAVFTTMNQGKPAMEVITSSTLKKAISIDELSTAEFVYNGIAEKRRDDSDDVAFRIAYKATVKAGIRMSDVDFIVDKDAKTVRPLIPEIVVNNAEVDINSIDYMPSNPDTNMQEVFDICKADATDEAGRASRLQDVARDNVKSIIEALTTPMLNREGYTLAWDEPESGLIQEAEAAQDGRGEEGEEAQ